jgi:hypothetical protein
MNRYVLKHLKQLPSLEKIYLNCDIDLTDSSIQKAFQTLEELGLYPKIETLCADTFWEGDLLKEIMKMRNLRTVVLFWFPFSRVPQEILLLQSLQILKIGSMALTEFSVGPGGLPSLTELDINCDKLVSISEDLSSLSLQKLTVTSSSIKELPQALWHMKSLKELHLYCDSLTSIPEDISLPHLQKLTIRSSQVSHYPAALAHMESLVKADLNCPLVTSYSEEIALLTKKLKYFRI